MNFAEIVILLSAISIPFIMLTALSIWIIEAEFYEDYYLQVEKLFSMIRGRCAANTKSRHAIRFTKIMLSRMISNHDHT